MIQITDSTAPQGISAATSLAVQHQLLSHQQICRRSRVSFTAEPKLNAGTPVLHEKGIATHLWWTLTLKLGARIENCQMIVSCTFNADKARSQIRLPEVIRLELCNSRLAMCSIIIIHIGLWHWLAGFTVQIGQSPAINQVWVVGILSAIVF